VLPLNRLLDYLEQAHGWPRRTVAVTFDDGYRDNYEIAAPILKEFDIPATFFITAGAIGTDRVMFWDEHLRDRVPWMNWEQVRALHRQGFEIGSHTMNHTDLGRASREVAWQELTTSKAKLEDELGAQVTLFAYPFGRPENMNESNRVLVREAGYRCCCSCCGGFVFPKDDPYRLKRTPLDPWYSTPIELHWELRRLAPQRWLDKNEPTPVVDSYLPVEESRSASAVTQRARTS
jgi:peptidoglycan/xylan/chitin deacetylase (PgdA/CDA1 family)